MKSKSSSGKQQKIQEEIDWKTRLSPQDYEQLKATFDLFDQNGSNFIDPQEISKILQELGLNRRNQSVFLMITDLTKKNRPINFEQFLQIICNRIGDTKTRDGLQKIFLLYDKDNSGTIDLEKFKTIAKELGQTMTDDQIIELMHNTHILNNTESNQFFTFEEFYVIVTKKRF